MTARVVFVSVSATGPFPAVHGVWEVGMVERRADGSQHLHHMFTPPQLGNAVPDSLIDSRFHERTAAFSDPGRKIRFSDTLDAYSWSQPHLVAARVARATAGAQLVGSDIATTAAFLDRMLRNNSSAPAWYDVLVDVDTLADGYRAGLSRGGCDNQDDHLAVSESAASALEFAVEAARIYDGILNPARPAVPAGSDGNGGDS